MTSQGHQLETALAVTLRTLLLWVIPFSAVVLIFRSPTDPDSLFVYNVGHLLVLQIAAFLLVRRLASLADELGRQRFAPR